MKFFLKILLFSAVLPFNSSAQFNCGNSIAQEKLFLADPTARERFRQVTETNTQNPAGKNENMVATYTIPVVFHVLHLGGSENISDAQLMNAVAILNRDFQKQNADTANIVAQFKNIAVDCGIQFSLATIDPDGKCTNGITRHYDTRTNWTINQSDYVYTWNPSKYLNVYVVKSLPSGVAGYAYLPGTAPPPMDAIVILNDYVGSIGTGNTFSSRALTHEVGHWFNLQHTWGSTNNPGVACGDDGVSDTPVTKGHSYCNLSNGSTCTSGVVENIQNYMEYSYCTNMYTQGQKTRMHNCLNSTVNGRNNLYSNSNLVATGVINPMTGCAPRPEFTANSTITCIGNNVGFTDLSYNGNVTTWNWNSAFASNTSTVQNGVLTFTNSGLAQVELVAGNSFGNDSISRQIVTVLAGAGSGTTNLVESFETGVFPGNKWIASQPGYGSPFVVTTSVAATGNNCLWINNFFDNPNGPVTFYSPAYDLTGMTAVELNFTYAYSQQSTTNNDQFKVFVSTDCGSNWSIVYSRFGTQLSTTGVVQTQSYSPQSPDWKTESVDLQLFAGSQQTYLKFEFTPDVNGPGNNFYIDDINVANVTSVKENNGSLAGIVVYPNPSKENLTIRQQGNQFINTIKVFDVSMREIFSIENNFANSGEIVVPGFSLLAKGVYFMQIKSGNISKVVKVIKE